MQHQLIYIIDFGSQFTQLIARRLRELNIYCEIHPFNQLPEISMAVKGIILSGGPASVRDKNAPDIDINLFFGKIPVLGICYGAQLIALKKGGTVKASSTREYGRATLTIKSPGNRLLKNIADDSQVWMSHSDSIHDLPEEFEITARTQSAPIAAFSIKNKTVFGFQFHPEVVHTFEGKQMLSNFVYDICGCTGDWTPGNFINDSVNELQKTLGNDKVILGLSGGVDSGVAAVLLHKAVAENLYCIFIDNGLLRKDESAQVIESYRHMGLNITAVSAAEQFYTALKGVADPEKKRKIIGKVFIDVFEEKARELHNVKWLAQGTIYPDVIESLSVKGPSSTIKSHHNVGGLPDKMNLKIIEPLKSLFKDEVRRIGTALGMEESLLKRHPFPGPGLGIRILSDVTAEKVKIIQEADAIFINRLKSCGLYDSVWQAGSVLLPVQSVGVMGDERTYENVIALRAVSSTDGMTADWCRLPYDFLADISNEIINGVKGVNRVVYDISSKPPATIEWE